MVDTSKTTFEEEPRVAIETKTDGNREQESTIITQEIIENEPVEDSSFVVVDAVEGDVSVSEIAEDGCESSITEFVRSEAFESEETKIGANKTEVQEIYA